MKTITALVLAAMVVFGTSQAEAHHDNSAAIVGTAIALGFAIAATRDHRFYGPTYFYGRPFRSHGHHWRRHHRHHWHGHHHRHYR